MDKMLTPFLQNILRHLGADDLLSVQKIQSLWSDYGAIYRLRLKGDCAKSVVVKCIQLEEQSVHPRGWASSTSHARKMKSYQIESHWYKQYTESIPARTKVPNMLYDARVDDTQVLVLEDLSIAYPVLKSNCKLNEAKAVVQWLAQFHAHFLNVKPEGLWTVGTYWHLATRPEEWEAMESGQLKDQARALDAALSNAKFQTIIHGDAKVANFCFAENGKVAAVDFQYVGGGAGVKDLAYFIGSCFTGGECSLYEDALVDYYFTELKDAVLGLKSSELDMLESTWRKLYPIAWADFNRFLMGWLPSHQKLHGHALGKNAEALRLLRED